MPLRHSSYTEDGRKLFLVGMSPQRGVLSAVARLTWTIESIYHGTSSDYECAIAKHAELQHRSQRSGLFFEQTSSNSDGAPHWALFVSSVMGRSAPLSDNGVNVGVAVNSLIFVVSSAFAVAPASFALCSRLRRWTTVLSLAIDFFTYISGST